MIKTKRESRPQEDSSEDKENGRKRACKKGETNGKRNRDRQRINNNRKKQNTNYLRKVQRSTLSITTALEKKNRMGEHLYLEVINTVQLYLFE